MSHKGALQWINLILAAVCTAAAVFVLWLLTAMDVLPQAYPTLIALGVIVWDLSVITVVSGEPGVKRNVCCFVVSIILILVLAYAGFVLQQVHRVMESITIEDTDADIESADAEEAEESGEAEEAEEADIIELTEDEDIFVVYLSGIDDTGDIEETVSRSDVNILAVVNTQTGSVQLINTPRDYYVYLPDKNAYDKLTHAGLYGIDCSMNTLAYLYEIEIDYYVRINFTGFETLIDDIGGIDIYVEEDFTSNDGIEYTAGWNHMDGYLALNYARERKAFSTGDIQRGQNQMQVIEAIADQLLSGGSLVMNLSAVLLDITDMVQTNMTTHMIYDLIQYQLETDTDWTFSSYTVSGSSTRRSVYSTSTSVSVMIPDESTVEEAKVLIQAALSGGTDESGDAAEAGN